MTQKTFIPTFIMILSFVLLSSCKKENQPSTPDTPVSTYQIPSIDEYMPERLLHLFDSLNVLHRGDEPPTINGNFMSESMNLLIVDKVPESNYILSPSTIPTPCYYEFKEQENNTLRLTFKSPHGTPGEIFFLEQSDTDSTYFIVKDNIALFSNDPIAPPYFKSSKFTPEDFRHAYIIGNGSYFTLYFYEIRGTTSRSLPLNAVIISGKISTDEEGKTIIEDFWRGTETMKYYNAGSTINLLIQYGSIPTPGDIVISKSPNALVEGCYGKQDAK